MTKFCWKWKETKKIKKYDFMYMKIVRKEPIVHTIRIIVCDVIPFVNSIKTFVITSNAINFNAFEYV